MHVNESADECECRRVRVQVMASTCECRCVRVCVYELVIALTQGKTMREMLELSEVMHF